MEKEATCRRHKHREEAEYDALIRRLSRIEGQVRGVKGMVEKEAYCTDILVQSSAVTAAVNAFNKELLSRHMHTCVVRDLKDGDEGAIDEVMDIVSKLMR